MFGAAKKSRSATENLTKGVGMLVGGVFVLFWSGLTLLADGAMLQSAAMQLWSYTYAATDATILQCDVLTDSDDDGTTYDLDIRYQYRVAGRSYTGDQYRFGSVKTPGNWCAAMVEQFPVDSECTVYYDRSRPERAVLLRGIEGLDLYILLFLTPFNLVMLTGWLLIYRGILPPPQFEESGGVRVRDDGAEIRAFVPDNSALFVAALAIGGSSFVMIFLVGCLTGMRPTLPVMFGVWGIILGTAVWFGGQRFARDRAGLSDLVIDRFGQRLTLPATYGRNEPRTLSFHDVEQITIKEERKVDSDGDTSYCYAVILKERGAATAEHRIFERSKRDQAERFLTWLRTTMGVAPDVQLTNRKRRKRAQN